MSHSTSSLRSSAASPGASERRSKPFRQTVRAWALPTCVLAAGALAAWPAAAQRYSVDLSQFDPAAVLSMGDGMLLRAPDAAIDRLFQAVHASSRSDNESAALCALFEPGAARDVGAFQRVVGQLGPDSRERFALAFTDIALAGLQGQPQPYDAGHAQQVLKSAAVTAALLHEGFTQGMAADAADAAGREARCRSFRWLVGVLEGLPQADRAAATRWLLREGLTLAGDAASASSRLAAPAGGR